MKDDAVMSFTYPGEWSVRDVELLAAEPSIDEVQFDSAVSTEVLQALETLILVVRPEFKVRFYGFYREECDLSFLRNIPSVRNLVVNCLQDAVNVDTIGELPNLETLGVGIYNLTSAKFLETVPATLKSLILEEATSPKLNLNCIGRFKELERLYVERLRKGIENISALPKLKHLTLRSLTLDSLSMLIPLTSLEILELKLGGTTNLTDLGKLKSLKALEIWQVRGLSDLGELSNCNEIQFLYLQNLSRVERLPSFRNLKNLRRVFIDGLKGLKSLAPLTDAPAIKELLVLNGNNFQPSDFGCFLNSPSIKVIVAKLGSLKKNAAVQSMLESAGIHDGPIGPFEFV